MKTVTIVFQLKVPKKMTTAAIIQLIRGIFNDEFILAQNGRVEVFK